MYSRASESCELHKSGTAPAVPAPTGLVSFSDILELSMCYKFVNSEL